MKYSIITSLTVIAITASGIAVGQTQVPNTFQAGQPARAADVNSNFDAVEAAIDSNASRIEANETAVQNNTLSISQLGSTSGVSVFTRDGLELGKFLAMRRINTRDSVIYVVSNKGYVLSVSAAGNEHDYGERRAIGFSGLDCTGDAYVIASQPWLSPWGFDVGGIASAGPDGSVRRFYTERGGAMQLDVPLQSLQARDGTGGNSTVPGCNNAAYSFDAFRAYPNDVAITGVSDTPPVGPLVMGIPLP